MSDKIIFSNHALQRLKERYEIQYTLLLESAMSDYKRYIVMHIQQDGAEVRRISWQKKEITYIVKNNVVTTMLPKESFIIPTKIGKKWNKLIKQRINLIPQNELSELKKEISEHKERVKNIVQHYQNEMKANKLRYKKKINNIERESYDNGFLKDIIYFFKTRNEYQKQKALEE